MAKTSKSLPKPKRYMYLLYFLNPVDRNRLAWNFGVLTNVFTNEGLVPHPQLHIKAAFSRFKVSSHDQGHLPWLLSCLDRGTLISVKASGCGTSLVRGPTGHK